MTTPAAGSGAPASRKATNVFSTIVPPAESPATTMRRGGDPLLEQVVVGRNRIVGRCRRGVLGPEPVLGYEGARARRSRQSADERAVAANRAEDVAAAVEVEQHGPVGAGGLQPGAPDRGPSRFIAHESRWPRRRCSERAERLADVAPADNADAAASATTRRGPPQPSLESKAPARPASRPIARRSAAAVTPAIAAVVTRTLSRTPALGTAGGPVVTSFTDEPPR